MRFKIDWASLMVGSKFTVLAMFDFVFEGNFSSKSPRGASIWRGDLTEGFLRHRFGGLIPSFLNYFKVLSIAPAPGIDPATFHSASRLLYRLN